MNHKGKERSASRPTSVGMSSLPPPPVASNAPLPGSKRHRTSQDNRSTESSSSSSSSSSSDDEESPSKRRRRDDYQPKNPGDVDLVACMQQQDGVDVDDDGYVSFEELQDTYDTVSPLGLELRLQLTDFDAFLKRNVGMGRNRDRGTSSSSRVARSELKHRAEKIAETMLRVSKVYLDVGEVVFAVEKDGDQSSRRPALVAINIDSAADEHQRPNVGLGKATTYSDVSSDDDVLGAVGCAERRPVVASNSRQPVYSDVSSDDDDNDDDDDANRLYIDEGNDGQAVSIGLDENGPESTGVVKPPQQAAKYDRMCKTLFGPDPEDRSAGVNDEDHVSTAITTDSRQETTNYEPRPYSPISEASNPSPSPLPPTTPTPTNVPSIFDTSVESVDDDGSVPHQTEPDREFMLHIPEDAEMEGEDDQEMMDRMMTLGHLSIVSVETGITTTVSSSAVEEPEAIKSAPVVEEEEPSTTTTTTTTSHESSPPVAESGPSTTEASAEATNSSDSDVSFLSEHHTPIKDFHSASWRLWVLRHQLINDLPGARKAADEVAKELLSLESLKLPLLQGFALMMSFLTDPLSTQGDGLDAKSIEVACTLSAIVGAKLCQQTTFTSHSWQDVVDAFHETPRAAYFGFFVAAMAGVKCSGPCGLSESPMDAISPSIMAFLDEDQDVTRAENANLLWKEWCAAHVQPEAAAKLLPRLPKALFLYAERYRKIVFEKIRERGGDPMKRDSAFLPAVEDGVDVRQHPDYQKIFHWSAGYPVMPKREPGVPLATTQPGPDKMASSAEPGNHQESIPKISCVPLERLLAPKIIACDSSFSPQGQQTVVETSGRENVPEISICRFASSNVPIAAVVNMPPLQRLNRNRDMPVAAGPAQKVGTSAHHAADSMGGQTVATSVSNVPKGHQMEPGLPPGGQQKEVQRSHGRVDSPLLSSALTRATPPQEEGVRRSLSFGYSRMQSAEENVENNSLGIQNVQTGKGNTVPRQPFSSLQDGEQRNLAATAVNPVPLQQPQIFGQPGVAQRTLASCSTMDAQSLPGSGEMLHNGGQQKSAWDNTMAPPDGQLFRGNGQPMAVPSGRAGASARDDAAMMPPPPPGNFAMNPGRTQVSVPLVSVQGPVLAGDSPASQSCEGSVMRLQRLASLTAQKKAFQGKMHAGPPPPLRPLAAGGHMPQQMGQQIQQNQQPGPNQGYPMPMPMSMAQPGRPLHHQGHSGQQMPPQQQQQFSHVQGQQQQQQQAQPCGRQVQQLNDAAQQQLVAEFLNRQSWYKEEQEKEKVRQQEEARKQAALEQKRLKKAQKEEAAKDQRRLSALNAKQYMDEAARRRQYQQAQQLQDYPTTVAQQQMHPSQQQQQRYPPQQQIHPSQIRDIQQPQQVYPFQHQLQHQQQLQNNQHHVVPSSLQQQHLHQQSQMNPNWQQPPFGMVQSGSHFPCPPTHPQPSMPQMHQNHVNSAGHVGEQSGGNSVKQALMRKVEEVRAQKQMQMQMATQEQLRTMSNGSNAQLGNSQAPQVMMAQHLYTQTFPNQSHHAYAQAQYGRVHPGQMSQTACTVNGGHPGHGHFQHGAGMSSSTSLPHAHQGMARMPDIQQLPSYGAETARSQAPPATMGHPLPPPFAAQKQAGIPPPAATFGTHNQQQHSAMGSQQLPVDPWLRNQQPRMTTSVPPPRVSPQGAGGGWSGSMAGMSGHQAARMGPNFIADNSTSFNGTYQHFLKDRGVPAQAPSNHHQLVPPSSQQARPGVPPQSQPRAHPQVAPSLPSPSFNQEPTGHLAVSPRQPSAPQIAGSPVRANDLPRTHSFNYPSPIVAGPPVPLGSLTNDQKVRIQAVPQSKSSNQDSVIGGKEVESVRPSFPATQVQQQGAGQIKEGYEETVRGKGAQVGNVTITYRVIKGSSPATAAPSQEPVTASQQPVTASQQLQQAVVQERESNLESLPAETAQVTRCDGNQQDTATAIPETESASQRSDSSTLTPPPTPPDEAAPSAVPAPHEQEPKDSQFAVPHPVAKGGQNGGQSKDNPEAPESQQSCDQEGAFAEEDRTAPMSVFIPCNGCGGVAEYCCFCNEANYCSEKCQFQHWEDEHGIVCKSGPASVRPAEPAEDV